jgi:serine/threonine-protein kinase HipA
MAVVMAVYADWHGLSEPLRLGWLHANRTRERMASAFRLAE